MKHGLFAATTAALLLGGAAIISAQTAPEKSDPLAAKKAAGGETQGQVLSAEKKAGGGKKYDREGRRLFEKLMTAAKPVGDGVEWNDVYDTFESIVFYFEDRSGDAAIHIASPSDWDALSEELGEWFASLDAQERALYHAGAAAAGNGVRSNVNDPSECRTTTATSVRRR